MALAGAAADVCRHQSACFFTCKFRPGRLRDLLITLPSHSLPSRPDSRPTTPSWAAQAGHGGGGTRQVCEDSRAGGARGGRKVARSCPARVWGGLPRRTAICLPAAPYTAYAVPVRASSSASATEPTQSRRTRDPRRRSARSLVLQTPPSRRIHATVTHPRG